MRLGAEATIMINVAKNVVLPVPEDDAEINYSGSNDSERISFDNPNGYEFNLTADLSGGNDQIISDELIFVGRVIGGPGDDVVHLPRGDDYLELSGGTGNDDIYGEADNGVRVVGGDGDDRIEGSARFTELVGGAGNDTLLGGGGFEGSLADGGPGNDTINVYLGYFGTIDGGDGNDKITARTYSGDVVEQAEIFGGKGDDRIAYALESDPDFTMDIYGGAGKDAVSLGALVDTVHIQAATTPAGKGRDVVNGFDQGQDHIALDGDANLKKAGAQDYAFVGKTSDPGAGQVGYHALGKDTIVEGFDGKTHFEVQLTGFHGTLHAEDFIL